MGTAMQSIRQQSSSRSIQSKLSLKTSVQFKIRSGLHNSQSDQLFCVQEVDSNGGEIIYLLMRVSFTLNFNQISIRDARDEPK